MTNPADLVLIKNDPAYNEAWPRAVVPYSTVHGVAEPNTIPWLPNDGALHAELPAGTPYGMVGTSSFYKRESFPGLVRSWANTFDGLDAFNTSENSQSGNWVTQGSDAGLYSNADIHAVRIVSMEPNTHRSYGPDEGVQYVSHANERLRILGEIPLRKFDGEGQPILDVEGNPDTSFMAKVPADTPFTFQMIDTNGMVLTMAQTWHQVRPGEIRNDCGGCHAHSQQPLLFETTVAGSSSYDPPDLTEVTSWLTRLSDISPTEVTTIPEKVVNVEFIRDIRPVLQRSCLPCHSQTNSPAPGALVLDDNATYGGMPGDYKRLADDSGADWGYPPLVTVGSNPVWRQTNASRYIRMFQSRRSLLIWKIFGKRMDGWTNADHPSAAIPGDPSSLPPGASINESDLDYTGTIMPPPGSGVPPLSEDEKMMFARWIDLGCPIGDGDKGWFLDDLRPTLTVSMPRQNENNGLLREIRVGMADAYSGLEPTSFSVVADFPVNGIAAGSELKGAGSYVSAGVFVIPLDPPILNLAESHVVAEVFDQQGNKKVVDTRFWVEPIGEDQTIVHLDPGQIQTERITIRFRDESAGTNHVVLGAPSIDQNWDPCTVEAYVEEPNDIRRLDVLLPPTVGGSYFLRVEPGVN